MRNYLLYGSVKTTNNNNNELTTIDLERREEAGRTSKQQKPKEVEKKKINLLSPVHLITDKVKNHIAVKIFDYFLEKNNENYDNSKTPSEALNLKRLKAKHKRLFAKLKRLKENQKILLNTYEDIEKHLKRCPLAIFVNERNICKSLEDLIIDASSTETNNHTDDDENKIIKDNDEKNEKKETQKQQQVTSKQLLANKLEIKLVRSWPPSKEFQESAKEEHDLYVKYQTKIHKDSPIECNWNQFQRFLCTSPLLFLSHTSGELTKMSDEKRAKLDESLAGNCQAVGYGSFHQQYRLNGKLVAVGVIDILSSCVSSVYFFYDPDYQHLNLGTYSALREIALARQLNKLDANIKSYYLGFYAHSCKKMRYKGQFVPSYLLCPEVYTWHAIEQCRPLLEKSKYARFAPVSSSNSVSSSSSSSKSSSFASTDYSSTSSPLSNDCSSASASVTAIASNNHLSPSSSASLITIDENENKEIDHVKIRVKFNDNDTRVIKFTDFCEYLNSNFRPQFKRLIEGYCKLFGKKFSENVIIKF